MENLEGRRPVLEALEGGRTPRLIYLASGLKGKAVERIWEEAKKQGITIEEVPRKQLDQMSETRNHQGVIARVEPYPVLTLDDFLKGKNLNLLLMLDQIQDPQNLGGIVRTAAFMGAQGIILPKRRSAGPTTAVARASAGALERIPLVQVTNLVRAIKRLQGEGFWAVGGHLQSRKAPGEVDLTRPILLLIGSEGKGLRRLVAEQSDELVSIPGSGNFDSLNASVAAGILLYEVIRQRME